MSYIYIKAKKYFSLLSISMLMVGVFVTSASAAITASTSLTIVNVGGRTYGGKLTAVDVTTWSQEKETSIFTGNWPSIPGLVSPNLGLGFSSPASVTDIQLPNGAVAQGRLWYEVYLNNAHVSSHGQSWSITPNPTPWAGFPAAGGLNSMIANVYSIDGGKNFWIHSWDYLAPNSTSKGGEGTWDDCWLGTMVHSFCDFAAGECNGRYRTNLYFSSFNDDPSCWGVQIMNQ